MRPGYDKLHATGCHGKRVCRRRNQTCSLSEGQQDQTHRYIDIFFHIVYIYIKYIKFNDIYIYIFIIICIFKYMFKHFYSLTFFAHVFCVIVYVYLMRRSLVPDVAGILWLEAMVYGRFG